MYHVQVWAGPLRQVEKSGKSWIWEGRALNVLFGSLPACTPRLGQTQVWKEAWAPLEVCP